MRKMDGMDRALRVLHKRWQSGFLAESAWLVGDAARWKPLVLIGVLVLQFAGQALEIAGVVWALRYIVAIHKGVPLALLGQQWLPRESWTLLWVFLGGTAAALGGSFAFVFWGRALIVRLVRQYEHYCVRRALFAFASPSAIVQRNGDSTSPRTVRELVRLLTKDARYCGRALNDFLLSIVPLMVGTCAVAGMLYWNGWFTFLLLAVVILLVPLHLLVHHRGANSTLRIEELARKDAVLKSEAILRIDSTMVPVSGDASWLGRLVENSQGRRYLDAYETRLRVAAESLLVGDFQMAVLICLLMLYFGWGALTAEPQHIDVLYYFVMLRYALGSLRSVGKHVSNFAVFHPCFGRYVRFVKSLQRNPAAPAAVHFPPSVTLTAADPIEGSLASLTLRPGEPLGVIAPFAVSRLTLGPIVSALFSGCPDLVESVLKTAVFARQDYAPVRESLAESLGLPCLSADQWANSPLARRRAELDPRALRRPVNGRTWLKVPGATKLLCACLAALRPESRWVFFDQKAYRQLPEEDRRFLLEVLADRFILLVYGYVPDRMPEWVGDHYVVLRAGKVRFIGASCEYPGVRAQLLPAGRNRTAARCGPMWMEDASDDAELDLIC